MKRFFSVVLCIVMLISCIGVFADIPETSGTPLEGHWDLAAPSEWAFEYVLKAEEIGMLDYFKFPFAAPVTRARFCILAYNMLDKAMDVEWKKVSPNPFDDTDNEKVIGLYLEGIVEGKGGRIFAPHDEITREEAATILDRIGGYMGLGHTELYYMFEDEAEISDWAMSSVQTVCNLGVMKGVGDNRFAPKDGYTTEQAITTLVRLYDMVKVSETFADKMYGEMPEDRNFMFSPLSIKMAMMMAANGADGETQQEILTAIDVENIEEYNKDIENMIKKYSESDLLKLNVSNSIWLNTDKTPQRFSDEYKKNLAEIFGATADEVTDKTAADEINGWVNEKTEGKIPAIVSKENSDFWAMLVNAVYFKGRWQKEFYKGATKEDIFTSKNGEEKSVDFMNMISWIGCGEADGVTVVKLPYLTREAIFREDGEYLETRYLEDMDISMYLMMSDNDFSPQAVLDRTDIEAKYIELSVPKFNVEYSTGLNDILKAIGINKAFEKDAEFEKMFREGNMWIDSTIHKTYIKVDEEGTEAAAVTAIGMAGSALPPEPVAVKFNKPFTFVIRDDTNGEILFMGRYSFAE